MHKRLGFGLFVFQIPLVVACGSSDGAATVASVNSAQSAQIDALPSANITLPTPTTVAKGTFDPLGGWYGVASDGVNVYYTDNLLIPRRIPGPPASGPGSVRSAPIAGGPASVIWEGEQPYQAPKNVWTDGISVYWTDAGLASEGLYSKRIGAAPDVPPTKIFTPGIDPARSVVSAFAFDQRNIYTYFNDTLLIGIPKDGSASTVYYNSQVDDLRLDIQSMVATRDALWVAGSSIDGSVVLRFPKDGNEHLTIAYRERGQVFFSSIVADGDGVYFATGTNAIMRIDLDGSSARQIAAPGGMQNALTVANHFVYWTEVPTLTDPHGAILRVPTSGGPVEQVVANTISPTSILAVGNTLLWTAQESTEVTVSTGEILSIPLQ